MYGFLHLFMLFLSSILRSVSPTFSHLLPLNYRNILRDHLKFEEVFSYIREMELQPGLDIITTYNICSMHFVNFHPLQRDVLYFIDGTILWDYTIEWYY